MSSIERKLIKNFLNDPEESMDCKNAIFLRRLSSTSKKDQPILHLRDRPDLWFSIDLASSLQYHERTVTGTIRGNSEKRLAERRLALERIANLHIEKLPEGVYLATSDEIQGLVVQGRTIQETIEIARDVAKKLLEAKQVHEGEPPSLLHVMNSIIPSL